MIRDYLSNGLDRLQAKLTATSKVLSRQLRLDRYYTYYAVVITAAVYMVRGHLYIQKPQLWAEDGAAWLASGVNHNALVVFRPYAGMFHITEGLFGYAVAHISLLYAPLIFNLAALGLYCLMVYYIFTPRSRILNDNFERSAALVMFCLIANMKEIFFNLSNAIFLLGISGFLIIWAKKPHHRIARWLENTLYVLSCLTLPFCFAYAAILIYARIFDRRKLTWHFWLALTASLFQALAMFVLMPKGRTPSDPAILTSKYTLLALYNQIIIPATRFARIDIPLDPLTRASVTICALAVMTALIALAFTVLKSRRLFYLILFLVLMTLASLVSPLAPVNSVAAARFLASVDGLSRYYIFGIVALYLAMIYIANTFLKRQYRYALLALFAAFGLVTSLRYHNFFIDKHFEDYTQQYSYQVKEFESGKVNSVMIPTNPKGFSIILKRSNDAHK